MTGFNFESARAARAANPRLTEFDTGEVFEPHVDRRDDARGWVDFDNDEGVTLLRMKAQPSQADADMTRVELDSVCGGRIEIVRDNERIWVGEAFGSEEVREEVRLFVSTAEHEDNSYTDFEGISRLMDLWAAADARRTWSQEGDDEDSVLVFSYWAGDKGRQVVDLIRFDTDAEEAVGLGWSLYGLPFDVDPTGAVPAAPARPQTVADLDGSIEAADWIQAGHVLDASEVEYLRGLVLPGSIVSSSEG